MLKNFVILFFTVVIFSYAGVAKADTSFVISKISSKSTGRIYKEDKERIFGYSVEVGVDGAISIGLTIKEVLPEDKLEFLELYLADDEGDYGLIRRYDGKKVRGAFCNALGSATYEEFPCFLKFFPEEEERSIAGLKFAIKAYNKQEEEVAKIVGSLPTLDVFFKKDSNEDGGYRNILVLRNFSSGDLKIENVTIGENLVMLGELEKGTEIDSDGSEVEVGINPEMDIGKSFSDSIVIKYYDNKFNTIDIYFDINSVQETIDLESSRYCSSFATVASTVVGLGVVGVCMHCNKAGLEDNSAQTEKAKTKDAQTDPIGTEESGAQTEDEKKKKNEDKGVEGDAVVDDDDDDDVDGGGGGVVVVSGFPKTPDKKTGKPRCPSSAPSGRIGGRGTVFDEKVPRWPISRKAYKGKLGRVKKESAEKDVKIAEMEREAERVKERRLELESSDKLIKTVGELTARIDELEMQLKKRQEENERKEKENEGIDRERNELKRKNERWEREGQEMEKELERLRKEKLEVEEQLAREERAREEMERKFRELEGKIREMVTRFEKGMAELEEMLKKKQEEGDRKDEEIKSLRGGSLDAEERILGLRQELERLEEIIRYVHEMSLSVLDRMRIDSLLTGYDRLVNSSDIDDDELSSRIRRLLGITSENNEEEMVQPMMYIKGNATKNKEDGDRNFPPGPGGGFGGESSSMFSDK